MSPRLLQLLRGPCLARRFYWEVKVNAELPGKVSKHPLCVCMCVSGAEEWGCRFAFFSRWRSSGPLPLAVTEFASEPELVSGGTETAGRTFPGCFAGRSGGRGVGLKVGRAPSPQPLLLLGTLTRLECGDEK